MHIVRATSAGFCMGVSLALRKLDEKIAQQSDTENIYILGSIIHNPQVVSDYAAKGVRTVRQPEEIPPGATVVVRAHGITRQVEAALVERGVEIIDATCPKVKAACLKIEKCTEGGRILLLYGESAHPEVKCLLSYAQGEACVFDSPDQLHVESLDSAKKYCLAAQTTQDRALFEQTVARLQARDDLDMTIQNTICDATRRRQGEAVELAREVDLFIVAGGYNSSNTRRLAEVIEAQGTKAIHVETAAELSVAELKQYQRIGLTAGASTPKQIIDEIEQLLNSLQG